MKSDLYELSINIILLFVVLNQPFKSKLINTSFVYIEILDMLFQNKFITIYYKIFWMVNLHPTIFTLKLKSISIKTRSKFDHSSRQIFLFCWIGFTYDIFILHFRTSFRTTEVDYRLAAAIAPRAKTWSLLWNSQL